MNISNKEMSVGKKSQKFLLVLFLGFLILWMYFSFSKESKNPISNSVSSPVSSIFSVCEEKFSDLNQVQIINFKELEKNPGSFEGTPVKYTGEVMEIQESGSRGFLRLAVTKESYGWSFEDIVWVDYEGASYLLKDDVTTVWGVLTGVRTYTSQANFQISIPSMTACIFKKITSQNPQAQTTSSNPATPTVNAFMPPSNAMLGIRTQIKQNVYLTVERPNNFVSDNSSSYYQPDSGNKYISIYVSFENESQNQLDYNPLDFAVVDSNGGSYKKSYTLASKSPELHSGTLNPSNRVSGYIIFEVPNAMQTSGFLVHYDSSDYPSSIVDFK